MTNINEAEHQNDLLFEELYESWSSLSLEVRKAKFQNLPRTYAEELFLSLGSKDQYDLISEASSMEKRSWIRLLAPDDAADLIQEFDADDREEIVNLLDPQTRREVTALLAYAEDRAGGLMSSRFVRLRPDMSVDEAISYLRIQAKTQVETIYYAYVLAFDQTLLGVVSFRELFFSTQDKKISDIMKTDLVKIPVELDQEKIGQIFLQNEMMALPVIDEQGHMKGIVTFDDVANVVQEEATEDIHKLGAVETLDAPYLQISLWTMIQKRLSWLVILFIGEMFTATALGHFQIEIEKAVVLALFIPLIISAGGNSGSQASTLIIRAMALGEVRLKDWLRDLKREILSGLALGFALGLLGILRVVLWPNHNGIYGDYFILIGFTVGISVLGCVTWGSIMGAMLPMLLRKLKLDPASASAPAVATLIDVTGLVIYFTAASLILKGRLL